MRQGIIYKGKLITLQQKEFCLPNGYKVKVELIRHPGASLVVAFITQAKILLLKQFRPVINAYLYELPAGTRKEGETLLTCARREIVEETGYSAGKLSALGEIYPVPGYSTEKITIFKAELLKKHHAALQAEKDEVIEVRMVTKQQVRHLFKTKKIIDAKTICALAFCGWL